MNTLDHTFLESKSFTPLPHPEGQNHITSTTLLYDVSEYSILGQCLRIAYPAVCISGYAERCYKDETHFPNNDQWWIESNDAGRPLYKPFIDQCDSYELDLGLGMGNVRVYWKRTPEHEC